MNKNKKSIDQMLMALPNLDIDSDDMIQVSDKGEFTPLLRRVGSMLWTLYWSDGKICIIFDIEGKTDVETIQKAYNYCVKQGWIKKERE